MRFIDEATLRVKAGDGGRGARHFRREKFVPFGGPDGGDGGDGGSIYLEGDENRQTLLDFVFKPAWEADAGEAGGGNGRHGKSGEDLIIYVPPGTELYNADTGEIVADITAHQERFLLAKGGRGGKGNAYFKSATNQAPEYSQPGEPGEEGVYRLRLKLIADVGLLGFPNAGKSTLISRISSARPKIADYPFTTLTPNLGVVRTGKGRTFVVADIPGLIPGASEGKGLGITFLKHVERTAILAHLIDPMMLDEDGRQVPPIEAFSAINRELSDFSEELAQRPQIVVFTKADAFHDEEAIEAARAPFRELGYEPLLISSVTGQGVSELVDVLSEKAERKPRAEVIEPVKGSVWDED